MISLYSLHINLNKPIIGGKRVAALQQRPTLPTKQVLGSSPLTILSYRHVLTKLSFRLLYSLIEMENIKDIFRDNIQSFAQIVDPAYGQNLVAFVVGNAVFSTSVIRPRDTLK